jgi:predicted RNase H-like HicB family nuclease
MKMNHIVERAMNGQELMFNLSFERDPESGWYVACVAELPGCVSQGATLDEAKANIADAITEVVEVMLQDAIGKAHRSHGSCDDPTVTEKATAKVSFNPSVLVCA